MVGVKSEHTSLECELLLPTELLEGGEFSVAPDAVSSMSEYDGL